MKWPWTKRAVQSIAASTPVVKKFIQPPPSWDDGIDCPNCDRHYDGLQAHKQVSIRCVRCLWLLELVPLDDFWEVCIRETQ